MHSVALHQEKAALRFLSSASFPSGSKVLTSLLGSKKSSSSSHYSSSSRSMSSSSSPHGPNGFRRPVNPSMVPKPLAAFKSAAPLGSKPSPAAAAALVGGHRLGLSLNSQQQQQRQGVGTSPPPRAASRGLGLLDNPTVLQNGKGGSGGVAAAAGGGGGGGQPRNAVMKGLGLAQKPKASLGGLLGKPLVL